MKPKKIPPWALIGGAVLLGVAFYFWKKGKEKKELEQETKQESTVAGVETPEGEYPYTIAGGSGGGPLGGALGNASETQAELRELFGEAKTERRTEAAESRAERSSFENALKAISTQISGIQLGNASGAAQGSTQAQGGGGGAPSEHKPGVTVTPTTPQDRCGAGTHSQFPLGTPPDCYRISTKKTGGGCQCHGHQNGSLECQKGKAPHCYW